jgi:hypothetical protein
MKNIVWKCDTVLEAECLYHCYLVKLQKKGMNKYMGSKIGYPDGTYEGTVVTHRAAYKKDLATYESEYQVLFTGTEAECRKFEQDYLKSNDAKLSKDYYNESNSGAFKEESKEFISCLEALESKIYNVVDTALSVILSWATYQVREEDGVDGKHVKWLVGKITDDPKYWSTKLSEKPLIALENFDGKGQNRRLGKNHTCAAGKIYFGAESKVTMPVILIPEKVWEKLTETELEEIGQLDNRQLDFKPKGQDTTTIINTLVKYCKDNNKNQDDPVVRIKLERHGFTSPEIKSLKGKIKTQIIKPTGLRHNEKFVKCNKNTALEESNNEYKDKDTHCIIVSSGMMRGFFNDWSKSLASKAVRAKTNLIVLYFHTGIEYWNNFASNKIEFEKKLNDMNLFLKENGGTGYNIMYREINPIQKKSLLENTVEADV